MKKPIKKIKKYAEGGLLEVDGLLTGDPSKPAKASTPPPTGSITEDQWNVLKQKYAGDLPQVKPYGASAKGSALDKRMKWLTWANQNLPTSGTPAALSAKAAKQAGIDPGMLLASSLEEGVGLRFMGQGKDYSNAYAAANEKGELKDYPVDAFRNYGLDQVGGRIDEFIKKGWVPADIKTKMKTFNASNELDEKEYYQKAYNAIKGYEGLGNFSYSNDRGTYAKIDKILEEYEIEGVPEMKASAQTAAFKDDESAYYAKAAFLRSEQDNLLSYAKQKGYKLTPEETRFFTMAAYNGGSGNGRSMLDFYGSQGKLGNNGFLKLRANKGQIYDNIMPRYAGANLFTGEGYFKYGGTMPKFPKYPNGGKVDPEKPVKGKGKVDEGFVMSTMTPGGEELLTYPDGTTARLGVPPPVPTGSVDEGFVMPIITPSGEQGFIYPNGATAKISNPFPMPISQVDEGFPMPTQDGKGFILPNGETVYGKGKVGLPPPIPKYANGTPDPIMGINSFSSINNQINNNWVTNNEPVPINPDGTPAIALNQQAGTPVIQNNIKPLSQFYNTVDSNGVYGGQRMQGTGNYVNAQGQTITTEEQQAKANEVSAQNRIDAMNIDKVADAGEMIATSSMAAINAFFNKKEAAQISRTNKRRSLQQAMGIQTNPYVEGTGSQAIMKKGGRIKYAKGGEFFTEDPKPKKKNLDKPAEQQVTPGQVPVGSDFNWDSRRIKSGAIEKDALIADRIQEFLGNAYTVNTGAGRATISNISSSVDPQFLNDLITRLQMQQMSPGYANMTPEQRIEAFYQTGKTGTSGLDQFINRTRTLGGSPSAYWQNNASNLKRAGLKYGGEIQGDSLGIQTIDGGTSKVISSSDYSNPMVEFTGRTHEQGGIGLQYGGSLAEVEDKEIGWIDSKGGLNIFGKLKMPGTSQTFKNIAKDIADQEGKIDGQKAKYLNILNNSNPANPYQQSAQSTAKVMFKSLDKQSKQIADKKEALADYQNLVLGMVEQNQKMKYGGSLPPMPSMPKMAYGGKIPVMPKAEDGLQINPGDDEEVAKIAKAIAQFESGNSYSAIGVPVTKGQYKGQRALGKYQIMEDNAKQWYKELTGKEITVADFVKDPKIQEQVAQFAMGRIYKQYKNPADVASVWFTGRPANNSKAMSTKDDNGTSGRRYVNAVMNIYNGGRGYTAMTNNSAVDGSSNPPGYKAPDKITTQDVFTYTPVNQPVGGSGQQTVQTPYGDAKRDSTPFTDKAVIASGGRQRGYQSPLDTTQIASELLAIATNQRQAVPGLSYEPNLQQTFDISYQLGRNENESTFKQASALAEQTGNMDVLAQLAAQKYKADQQYNMQEIQGNAQQRLQTYAQNINTLNDAKVKNLALTADQQAKQAQADFNTRSQDMAAFKSIAAKVQQNKLENKTYNAYANLFQHYGFDKKGNVTFEPDKVAQRFTAGEAQQFGMMAAQQGAQAIMNGDFSRQFTKVKNTDGSTTTTETLGTNKKIQEEYKSLKSQGFDDALIGNMLRAKYPETITK